MLGTISTSPPCVYAAGKDMVDVEFDINVSRCANVQKNTLASPEGTDKLRGM